MAETGEKEIMESNGKWCGISAASQQSGVSQKQLYYWEQIGILKPKYEPFGFYLYRRYSNADIQVLKTIKRYLASGYTLKAATRLAKQNVPDGSGMILAGGKSEEEALAESEAG